MQVCLWTITSVELSLYVVANGYGNSALHEAAHGGHAEVVSALLNAGANVHLTNHKGSTPLHFACFSEHADSETIVRQLLTAGADANASDHTGMTPLLVCCSQGR